MARRVWFALTALLLTAGCYRYTPTAVPAPGSSYHPRLARAQVTLRNGQQLMMERAYVRGDSLRTDKPLRDWPAAVALSDIDRLDAVEFSKGETARWTVIVGGSILVALLLLMMGTDKS